jgi:hypothetical protein
MEGWISWLLFDFYLVECEGFNDWSGIWGDNWGFLVTLYL